MILNYINKIFIISLISFFSINAFAEPVDLFQSYAGNVNFVGVGATRRTQPNGVNACSVLGVNTNNTANITGIPAGATIRAAHLYWAGSYSTDTGSTRTTPDYSVVFEGGTVNAPTNRQYTATYTNYDFFSGVVDVTSQVNTKRNGSYSFRGLSVNTATPHCGVEGVLAGWSLLVVYESASEDFRVINLYEGFQAFRNNSITLTPDNFRIPNSGINGKHATITWDGDDTLNNASENIVFNGNALTDASNPLHEQFNSKSNISSISPSTGSVNNNSYGVDFDAFDISPYLAGGSTAATSTYSSGTDLVLLSTEIISVTNTPVSDLEIIKTATSIFNVGSNATYNIAVKNIGPNVEPGTIVVTDTLPTGLSYVSAAGTGWSCSAVLQNVTCNRAGSLAVGASASPITLTVAVATAASSVSNTASVSGTNFDNVPSNNNSTAVVAVNVISGVTLLKELTGQDKNDDNYAEKKEKLTYTITLTNSGVTDETITIEERVPAGTTFVAKNNDFVTASCIDKAAAGTVCSLTSPNVPAGSSITMDFIVKVHDPVSTTSVVNYVIEGGDTPPACSVGNSSDPRCVVIATTLPAPSILLQKTSVTLSDPVNGTTNPKAIPGAIAEYSIIATNSGNAAADNNSIIISDAIPANTALYVGTITGWNGPIRFINGPPSSGLSYNFVSLASTTDGLSFSNNSGSSYSYTPSPDADGVDTNVTNVRISTQGQFLAPSGSGNPTFKMLFRVKVQ